MTSHISNVYRLRWQRDAHRALGEFLKVADLPALAWRIATSGALVGDVDSLTLTAGEQRAAFDAWVRRLDAMVWPERTDVDGTVHLHAKFAWARNDEVRGAIRAAIAPPIDEVTP
ncbi:hypothetical protein F7R91_14580 [Streptomyces luteolifulvus]|uniref:Uncharacterized protein n=1 Tax=Streptomyces luteolifulvus TaxID=2615112 RepID=A0A6H9UZX9_9ACTN|nr:hypothetical protein [Streptomyces luteolifulvus]KAB1146801.1 hypothetical protein F7R91_14580 [Streptomyces luteolifulvus]